MPKLTSTGIDCRLDLVNGMLAVDASMRLDMAGVLASKWFEGDFLTNEEVAESFGPAETPAGNLSAADVFSSHTAEGSYLGDGPLGSWPPTVPTSLASNDFQSSSVFGLAGMGHPLQRPDNPMVPNQQFPMQPPQQNWGGIGPPQQQAFPPPQQQHAPQQQRHRGVARPICKYTLNGGACQIPNCEFFHPPGTRLPPSHRQFRQQTPRPRPGPGYVCHNCGDTSLSHFKADCPHPQRCRYTTHGGICTRPICPFFHPAGTRVPPGPAASQGAAMPQMPRPRPGPGYVCHNCGDNSLSHFKADCPHPQRCRYTTHGGICSRPQCQFFHPPGAYRPTF